MNNNQINNLIKEMKILRHLDHLYVIKLIEVYEDNNFLYMVFENFAGKESKYFLHDLVEASE